MNLPADSKQKSSLNKDQIAGGLPSIVSTLEHTLSEMNPYRTFQCLKKVNQQEGFDCPGCAWPEPKERKKRIEFCENGAKAIADEATQKKITSQFFKKYSLSHLLKESEFWLGKQGRLTQPMLLNRKKDRYDPLSWELAYELIAEELSKLNSPHEAAFYTSGRTSNEAAFLYQLFARSIGTNNLPDCSNLCHESSGVGLTEVIGIGKGTVSLEDFDFADTILIIGQNPGTNHPRMLSTLQKAARRGCQIITINPLREAGTNLFKHPQEVMHLLTPPTQISTFHLPVKINGDDALLKGIIKEILTLDEIENGKIINHSFINQHTVGFESFSDYIKKIEWDAISNRSGLSVDLIKRASQIISQSKSMICCWAMGVTQHKNSVAIVQEIVNLLLLGGHFGRAGAGACPVRGHSNVQGDRTMGITSNPNPIFLESLKKHYQFEPPTQMGLTATQTIEAMLRDEIKFFMCMGGNFLSASPDTEITAKALQKCQLTVQISTKLNRSHLICGNKALILPALARTEKDMKSQILQVITVENSMGFIHPSKGHLNPASPFLKSEIEIICDLALKVFQNKTSIPWNTFPIHYDEIRNHIEKIIPGFDNFNNKIREGGFSLFNPVRDRLSFLTSDKKAHFTCHPLEKGIDVLKYYQLMTLRSHDQYNSTIYGLNDRYRGIKSNRHVVFMNEEDIKNEGLSAGQKINLVSHFNEKIRKVENFLIVPYQIPKKCLAAYFPECNPLIPLESVADKSLTPTYKSVAVTIEPLLK